MKIQVTIDCADPHRLVEFWGEALEYQIEDHTALIEQLLADGRLPEAAVVSVRDGKGFAELAACVDPAGEQPRLLFQRVPEGKTVKNRVHLDLQYGPEDAPAQVERMLGLGATLAWVSDDKGGRCTTLRDPEGNEFCVT